MCKTRRQSVLEALLVGPMTAVDLARQFGVPVKTIIADLGHIRKSSKHGLRFVIRQAECSSCGFRFKDRHKIDTPSRCPRCRSEQIRDPEFTILD